MGLQLFLVYYLVILTSKSILESWQDHIYFLDRTTFTFLAGPHLLSWQDHIYFLSRTTFTFLAGPHLLSCIIFKSPILLQFLDRIDGIFIILVFSLVVGILLYCMFKEAEQSYLQVCTKYIVFSTRLYR